MEWIAAAGAALVFGIPLYLVLTHKRRRRRWLEEEAARRDEKFDPKG